jgi:hypothetical protein
MSRLAAATLLLTLALWCAPGHARFGILLGIGEGYYDGHPPFVYGPYPYYGAPQRHYDPRHPFFHGGRYPTDYGSYGRPSH